MAAMGEVWRPWEKCGSHEEVVVAMGDTREV